MKSIPTAAFMAACTVLCASAASAQGGYGTAVAAAGDVLYVAEPLNVARAGILYAYMRTGRGAWTEAARLRAPASHAGDRFAQSVAASGNGVLVGYPAEAGGAGAVHAFTRSGTTWRHIGRLAVQGSAASDSLGLAVALDGDMALASAPGARAAYVFRRNGQDWSEEARLTVDGLKAGDRFGVAVAAADGRIVVGAPGSADGRGGAYVFEREGGAWVLSAHLVPTTADAGSAVGSSVAIMNGRIVLGAPGRDGGAGAVFIFAINDNEQWTTAHRLHAFDGGPGSHFGASVAVSGNDLWVGVPGSGSVHRFTFDHDRNGWRFRESVADPAALSYTRFGAAIAAADRAVIVGIPGVLGAGTALVVEPRPDSTWSASAPLRSAPEEFPAVTGGARVCENGTAASFACSNVDLIAYLPISAIGGGSGVHLNDIHGWTDPETKREYAIVGRSDGTSFVDVTDPINPRHVGQLPVTTGARPGLWRSIAVYRDHAFIVGDSAGGAGVQIFELTQLRDVTDVPASFTETALYQGIRGARSIAINEETGLAVVAGAFGSGACNGGLHMIDVREPAAPEFAGCFVVPVQGAAGSRTLNDAQCITYAGPDDRHVGSEICFSTSETALLVVDVTDREKPVALAHAMYPNAQFASQGWITDDHRHFYMNDALDELAGVVPQTRTIVWDMAALDAPTVAGEFLGVTRASDRSLRVVGDTMYQSNHVAGLRVIDISNRTSPREVGFFDSVPNSENAPGFGGSWSSFPFPGSGTIIFTSAREGLFVVRLAQMPQLR